MSLIDQNDHYYAAEQAKGESSAWRFKVYHYSPDGNTEIVDHRSEWDYCDREEAEDAAAEWCDENDIDAECFP